MTMAHHPWKVEHRAGRPAERSRTAAAPGPAHAPVPPPGPAPAAAAAAARDRSARSSPASRDGADHGNGSLLGRIAGGAAAIAAGAARIPSSWWQRRKASRLPRRPRIRRQECTDLLSFLRAAVDKPVPTIVIAGAGGGEGTTRVVDGIAEAARDAGVRMFAAELGGSPGRPLLQQRRVISLPQPVHGQARLAAARTADVQAFPSPGSRPPAAAGSGPSASPAGDSAARTSSPPSQPTATEAGRDAVTPAASTMAASAEPAASATPAASDAAAVPGGDGQGTAGGQGAPEAAVPAASAGAIAKIQGGQGSAGLGRWTEHTGASVDFILVEAPSLDRTADAALLARACDGLVLVVESEVTPRESLRRAVRVAEVSGCRVLGLVVNEARRPLPDWLHRLLSGTSRGR
jgi:hypothetical protein